MLARTARMMLARTGAARTMAAVDTGAIGTEYCPYTETSKHYDTYRTPIGLDFVLDSLATLPLPAKPLGELALLDAGCGSGTYLHALKDHVKSIEGLEMNDGMIAEARAKLPAGTRLEQGTMTKMDGFADGAYDAIITTQVLHHLDTDTERFPNCALAFKQVARCLRPGGVYAISTGTPEQHVCGFWWAPLIPDAIGKVAKRFPPMPVLERLLGEAGMEVVKTYVPAETLVPAEQYLDLEGAFTAEYRASDSSWSMASEAELAAGLATLRATLDAGEGAAFLEEREAARTAGGQTTVVIARKK